MVALLFFAAIAGLGVLVLTLLYDFSMDYHRPPASATKPTLVTQDVPHPKPGNPK